MPLLMAVAPNICLPISIDKFFVGLLRFEDVVRFSALPRGRDMSKCTVFLLGLVTWGIIVSVNATKRNLE